MPGMSGHGTSGMSGHDMSGMDMGFGMGIGGMDLGGLGDGTLSIPGRYVTAAGDDPLSGTLAALGNLLAARQLDAGDVRFPVLPRQRAAGGGPVFRRRAARLSVCDCA
jgi:hypothetical protein